MPEPALQPRQYRLARPTPRRIGFVLAVLTLVLGVGAGVWQQSRSPAAVAAPVSHDGLAAKVVAREPSSLAQPGTSDPAQAASAPIIAAAPAGGAPAPARPAPLVQPGSSQAMGEFFVHVPPTIRGRLRVLVALHGMGGAGDSFCEAILSRTDSEQWLVVAPTYAYGDWRDPNTVMREESSSFIPRLHQFLQELPARTGLDLEPRAILLGYSRGAQLAQRFAMVYPEQTKAVAAISAGTYTLPLSSFELDGQRVPLNYPFGTADLQERFGRSFNLDALRGIPFWIGVGSNDRNPADLPRQWDPYLGNNRVSRAETFARRLADLGAFVQLTVFDGVDHAVGDNVRAQALDFLANAR